MINCKDVYLPQNRNILYVVGILEPQREFQWPKSNGYCIALAKLLDSKRTNNMTVAPHTSQTNQANLKACMKEIVAAGHRPDKENIVIDLDCGSGFRQWQVERSPCLTATRANHGGFYVTSKKRRLTLNDMFRLQGIIPEEVPWQYVKGLTRVTMGHAIGNAFPVSVMCHLIPAALFSAGIIDAIPKNQFQEKGLTFSRCGSPGTRTSDQQLCSNETRVTSCALSS